MADASKTGGGKKRRDRRIKLIMLALIAAAAVAVYLTQLRPPPLDDCWGEDLPKALATAGKEKRVALVFFRPAGGDYTTSWVIWNSLQAGQVRRAIELRNPVCVALEVPNGLGSDLAEQYDLKALPTILVLSSEGKVLDRAEGKVGHARIEQMLNLATRSALPAPRPPAPVKLGPAWSRSRLATLSRAERENRRVVMLLMPQPTDENTSRLIRDVLNGSEVRSLLDGGKFLCVAVAASTSDPIAREAGIRSLPALLVLSPQGRPIGKPLAWTIHKKDVLSLLRADGPGGT